jgi:hypothetical protein
MTLRKLGAVRDLKIRQQSQESSQSPSKGACLQLG